MSYARIQNMKIEIIVVAVFSEYRFYAGEPWQNYLRFALVQMGRLVNG
jgi:hypothetical protein